MKRLLIALMIALLSGAVFAEGNTPAHPFNATDLAMMDRVSDPQLSPDRRHAAFSVRQTDFAANKGVTRVWTLDLSTPGAAPQTIMVGNNPRWSADGKTLYFLSDKSGSSQLWNVAATGGSPTQVSHLPLDVNNYKVSPDGRHILLSMDVFMDCTDLACTRARLDARAADKSTGRLYDRLFVRHWNVWMDGRRSQLFMATLAANGQLAADPVWLTKGLDCNVPSKPEGDDSEYAISPDGRTVYFDAKTGGSSEAWTTNFDIYSVAADGSSAPKDLTTKNLAWDGFPLASPDGRTLYYLAMKTPGFEADRFAIMARDLASGALREVDPHWDRSAGPLQISADGETLYTTADDDGNHPLFAVNIAGGQVKRLLGDG
ncbi:MAG: S9 family peptidase, partial [Gammaproteobacteria bacterium]